MPSVINIAALVESMGPSRLRKNYFGRLKLRRSVPVAQQENNPAGCSKRPFSKAAASEEARRTLRYVEPLSEARTKLADFFSILLGGHPTGRYRGNSDSISAKDL